MLKLSPDNAASQEALSNSRLDTLAQQKLDGISAFDEKRYHDAIPILSAVTEEAPADAKALLMLAKAYFNVEDYQNAFVVSGSHLKAARKSIEGIFRFRVLFFHFQRV